MMSLSIWCLIMAILSAITLNANGLHDAEKWSDLWVVLPHVDLICLQETHLLKDQEFAFQLYSKSYNWYFSHGTSNSASVAMGIHCCSNVQVSLVGEVKGRIIALDVCGEKTYRYVSIYAPNDPSERRCFFGELGKFVVDNTFLLGDFNSVVCLNDCLSGKLDPTSQMLREVLEGLDFQEIPGSHQKSFTYNHPSILNRKSHLDQIYMNFENMLVCGYCLPVSVSDHYLVGMFSIPDGATSPKQWRFLNDLLLDTSFNQQIHLVLENFDNKNLVESWEMIKLKLQALSQKVTVFHQRQTQHEITSVRITLSQINKRIFDGDNLETDRLWIESRLDQCLVRRNFLLNSERQG